MYAKLLVHEVEYCAFAVDIPASLCQYWLNRIDAAGMTRTYLDADGLQYSFVHPAYPWYFAYRELVHEVNYGLSIVREVELAVGFVL